MHIHLHPQIEIVFKTLTNVSIENLNRKLIKNDKGKVCNVNVLMSLFSEKKSLWGQRSLSILYEVSNAKH